MGEGSWPGRMHLTSEVTAADWVVEGLATWGSPMRVRNLVPAVFQAYARILPPATSGARQWRWHEIAAVTGVTLHAGTRYSDLSGWRGHVDGQAQQPWGVPMEGELPQREADALATVLAAFTSAPDRAYFCLWEGYGDPQVQALSSRPRRVRAENRAYHLLTGPVAAVTDLVLEASYCGANLWWPHDRAWLVATEIDGFNTFVGASRDAIAALFAAPALEAVVADADTPLDSSPWPTD